MQVDRHLQLCGGFKDRQKFGIVQETAANRAIEHRALEAKLVDATFELLRGMLGVFHGQRGEPAEALWMLANRLREFIVHICCKGSRILRGELVKAHGCERQHLEVDAAFIHRSDAAGVQVKQLRLQLGHGVGKLLRAMAAVLASSLKKRSRYKMLFKCNRLHGFL